MRADDSRVGQHLRDQGLPHSLLYYYYHGGIVKQVPDLGVADFVAEISRDATGPATAAPECPPEPAWPDRDQASPRRRPPGVLGGFSGGGPLAHGIAQRD